MRLFETFSPVEHEILNEVYVDSSWIEDIELKISELQSEFEKIGNTPV